MPSASRQQEDEQNSLTTFLMGKGEEDTKKISETLIQLGNREKKKS